MNHIIKNGTQNMKEVFLKTLSQINPIRKVCVFLDNDNFLMTDFQPKNTQKEVIDSIEKLSEFSNLLLEQQETIKELEKEIDILKHERDLALQSKSKSRYKDNDQTIEL